ncbi:DUF6049 family protein [Streptomyces yaizuensis]|uniref:DUF6049 family protein n=1 Tax=Streptomyces yaizuensis TaxID=2989713 RepID=A0ABQ5P2D4_9ACTN|nr:DUF6049 family protein [Streptomyces sp. YSPA8]GLF96767.1 DUF6049 family protein [Streptomyces sp. YSPA8]
MAEPAVFQGVSSPSPARRWLRRTAAVLAGVPLVAGLLGGVAVAPAQAAPEARAGAGPVDVSLTTLAPAAPVEGQTLTITGTVVNRGKQAVSDAEVALRVGPALYGRTGIDEADRRTDFHPSFDGLPLDDSFSVELPKLAPGVSRDFSLRVPVDELNLTSHGVYQLGVTLSGRTARTSFDQVLGIERTFLPWQPEALEKEKKTRITYLWPLVSSSHLTSQTSPGDQQTPVFADESLAREIAPDGRLGQMVSLGRELPVTWVIDPDLLSSVAAMTEGYRVRDEDGEGTVAGKNQLVAKAWLSDLQKAVEGGKVVALPFADPDLASLAHQGKNVSGSLKQLQQATSVASATVETILHVEPSTDFAWPVEGAIDPSIVAVATSAGADKVITRSDSLQDNLNYTTSAARPIGGGTTAVVSDSRLSKAFQGDMLSTGTSTLAVQEFLAQTLAVTLQNTDRQRSLVVAPQRMPTASQAQSMASALVALGAQRWTEPSNLVAAAAAKPDPSANTRVPSAGRYPDRLRKQELPVQAFQDIRETQDALNKFSVILTQKDRVETPFGRAIDRELSTSWRGRPVRAEEYRTGVRENLSVLTEQVRLIKKSAITLSGRSATIPITVQNRLMQDVDGLVLRLSSDNAGRLSLDGDEGVAGRPIEIQAGHSQSVKFDAKANANGQVRMRAQLMTADNKPYGPEMQFTVKVSEITPTVMLVIAGGVLLLVLAGVRMYTQRKRAAAQEQAAGPENGAEHAESAERAGDTASAEESGQDGGGGAASATAGDRDDSADGSPDGKPRPSGGVNGTDPGQPSDPTPDTGPENGTPSGTGEKVDR